MMKNNEPAFPGTPTDRSGQIAPTEMGMTLRDYFAAKAMEAILSIMEQSLTPSDIHSLAIASFAYQQADAMLAVREKNRGE